ncbi:MAG: hypothetical protein GY795_00045 [Desulfobacterales bacterium]|nr:hypothetical protein [Desulfobacterales bacterium]
MERGAVPIFQQINAMKYFWNGVRLLIEILELRPVPSLQPADWLKTGTAHRTKTAKIGRGCTEKVFFCGKVTSEKMNCSLIILCYDCLFLQAQESTALWTFCDKNV